MYSQPQKEKGQKTYRDGKTVEGVWVEGEFHPVRTTKCGKKAWPDQFEFKNGWGLVPCSYSIEGVPEGPFGPTTLDHDKQIVSVWIEGNTIGMQRACRHVAVFRDNDWVVISPARGFER